MHGQQLLAKVELLPPSETSGKTKEDKKGKTAVRHSSHDLMTREIVRSSAADNVCQLSHITDARYADGLNKDHIRESKAISPAYAERGKTSTGISNAENSGSEPMCPHRRKCLYNIRRLLGNHWTESRCNFETYKPSQHRGLVMSRFRTVYI